MRPSLFLIACALCSLLLAACGSDTALRIAPPLDPETNDGGGPGPGGWPGLPGLPSGPWSDIDPGDMPNVYFVAALLDSPGSETCAGVAPGEREDTLPNEEGFDGTSGDSAESGVGNPCPVNYAIVDLFGQVVDFFTPAAAVPGGEFVHIDLLPSGPGRFLATAQGWGDPTLPPSAPDEAPPAEDGPVSTGVWTPWVAWEVDAVAGTTTLVAYQDPVDYRVVIPGTGKRLDVGVYEVRAAIDPVDPDWLYLWGANYGCNQEPLPLRATHRTMSQVLDRFWSIDDIVGDDVRDQLDGRTLFPTEFSTSVDENGASHLLLGMGDQGCNAGSEPVNVLVDFTPDTETSWSHLSGAPWSTAPVGWAPWSEGGAVQIESPWSEPRWHMVTPDGEQSGPAPGGVWNVRAGPMLDPEGPTFVVLGRDPAAPVGDSVFVIHDGDDVWSIDQLRFGLQLRDVTIMDIIVLPPWEGAE